MTPRISLQINTSLGVFLLCFYYSAFSVLQLCTFTNISSSHQYLLGNFQTIVLNVIPFNFGKINSLFVESNNLMKIN